MQFSVLCFDQLHTCLLQVSALLAVAGFALFQLADRTLSLLLPLLQATAL